LIGADVWPPFLGISSNDGFCKVITSCAKECRAIEQKRKAEIMKTLGAILTLLNRTIIRTDNEKIIQLLLSGKSLNGLLDHRGVSIYIFHQALKFSL
jgi:hypothetical protein